MSVDESSPRRAFGNGVKGVAPILLGVIPFGMIYGVLAVGAGLTPLAAQAMSSVVFAGSAQFVAAGLFRVGAPGVVLVLTTLIVNLRHVLYSASVAPYLAHLSWRWKALLAYLLTDEAYAVAITHYLSLPTQRPSAAGSSEPSTGDVPTPPQPPNPGGSDALSTEDRQTPPQPPSIGGVGGQYSHWHFLGAGLGLWSAWQASTAAGIALGAQIPASWGLDFTLALTFIALVVPALKDRPSVAAALSAGVVAVAAAAWPYKMGLMAAALTGIVVGLLLDLRRPETSP